jgi:hypothetical protein
MGIGSRRIAYLTLNELAADPALARRLPPDLARRFHALPVAEDRGRITVAMAHPDDEIARDAVLTVLGASACVVQADPVTIDTLLAEIWGGEAQQPLDPVEDTSPEPMVDGLWEYAQALGILARAYVSYVNTVQDLQNLAGRGDDDRHNLIVLPKGHDPLLRQVLSRLAANDTPAHQIRDVPSALLVAQRPRWPLGRMLLILGGEDADQAAVDWVVRLAQPSGSAVTVLAMVPPVPAMYSGLARMQHGLPELLTTDTPLGRQMRQAAHRLAECDIESTLCLRQGPPNWQVGREILTREYDLIALAVRPRRRWLRGPTLVGAVREEPASLVLCKTDRPVLIAIPTMPPSAALDA